MTRLPGRMPLSQVYPWTFRRPVETRSERPRPYPSEFDPGIVGVTGKSLRTLSQFIAGREKLEDEGGLLPVRKRSPVGTLLLLLYSRYGVRIM